MIRDPWLEKRKRYLMRRRKAYADNQLDRLNDMRRRRGKEPYTSVSEIGSDLLQTVAQRQRDERGRFV